MNVYEDNTDSTLKDEFSDLANQHKVSAQISPWQARLCYILCISFEWIYYLRGIGLVILLFGSPPATYFLTVHYLNDGFLALLLVPASFAFPFMYWVLAEAILRTLFEYIFFHTDKLPKIRGTMDAGPLSEYQT